MLHPVMTEFQELIDTDPVVRMYINQMIAQVPSTKPYRKRHLESVMHMMRLLNEVLTMAPEFGGHMVVEPMNSQSYLAHVAARAVILIEADNPVIGLMAFVAVGMSEVSSCLIGPKVTPGYHVGKGEELGYFQYGGSTHCLVFRPGAIAEFALAAIPQPHDPNAPLMLVRSKLATARTGAETRPVAAPGWLPLRAHRGLRHGSAVED